MSHPGRLIAVSFGSRWAACVSACFALAVAALLYLFFLQIEKAVQVELPTGLGARPAPQTTSPPLPLTAEILVLNSYHVGHAWSDHEVEGVINFFHEAAPGVRLHIEYLDCKHHPAEEHFEQLKELFQVKYGRRQIPLVMAADNPALEFAVKNRNQLFPNATIVFCGINNFAKEMVAGQARITGLAETLNAVETIRLALQLHPTTKEVLLLHDFTATGLATCREAETQLRERFAGVNFRQGEENTKKELIQFLQKLPPESIILALSYSVFKDGEVIGHEDLAKLLATNSSAPVYGLQEERLGYGIVGGYLLSGRQHGVQAAEMALKLLTGAKVEELPVVLNPPSRPMFDYPQLLRFHLPLNSLPAGRVVVNRPIPFLAAHRYLVITTLLIMVLLTSGILVLGTTMYRRRAAEEELRRAKQELESRVAARTNELQAANRQLQTELCERQKVEESLRQREVALNESQRLAHIGSWDWDAERDAIWWSEEYYRIYGLDPQQPTPNYGDHLHAYTAEGATRLDEAVKKALASGEPYELDLQLAQPTATTTWIVARGEAKRDGNGRICGLRGTAQNISERKQAEEQRLANLRFLECLDRVNLAIQGSNDLDRMMDAVLEVVLELFNCERAVLIAPCQAEASAWRLAAEKRRPSILNAKRVGEELPISEGVAESFRLSLASESPVQFGPGSSQPLPPAVAEQFGCQSFMVLALRLKVGKPWQFAIQQCSAPRQWSQEEEQLMAEIGRRLGDALTSLLMLRDLRDNESKLVEAQRIAHFGYWERDLAAGRITLSEEACRIFGLGSQTLTLKLEEWHQRWLELIHPEDRDKIAQAITEALRGGPRYDVEYRVIRPSGESRVVRSYAEVTFDEVGRARRIIGTMQDITEKKLAEAELRRLNDQLEARVTARTAELAAKNEELERLNQLFIGRELRMVELKEKLKILGGARKGENTGQEADQS